MPPLYWCVLILANIPICLLAARLVFGTVGDFLAALCNGVGLKARVWTMEDTRREEPLIIANFKASLVLLFILAAILAEHCLLKRLGWI